MIMANSKDGQGHKDKFENTIESLEFVVAQFSWNSWVPLIYEFTSQRTIRTFFIESFNEKKKVHVYNIPYCINKQTSMYSINSVNNQIIAPLF